MFIVYNTNLLYIRNKQSAATAIEHDHKTN